MTDIRAKFHRNPSTDYKDIASRETRVDGQRTDGRHIRQTYKCLRRGFFDGGNKTV